MLFLRSLPTPSWALLLAFQLASTLSPNLQGGEFALLISVGGYSVEEFQHLGQQQRELLEMHRILRDAGYDSQHLRLLHDAKAPAADNRLVPTAANIRQQLADFLKPRGEDDGVLVVVAGHTLQFAGEKPNYFCPANASPAQRETLIPVKEFYDSLETCAASRKLLIYDAGWGNPLTNEFQSQKKLSLRQVAEPQAEAEPKSFAVLFSAQQGKGSHSHLATTLQESFFTHALLQAIKGTAETGDADLSMTEVVQFATAFTAQHSRSSESLFGLQQPLLKGKVPEKWSVRKLATEPAQPADKNKTPELSPAATGKLSPGNKAGQLWAENGIAMKFRWCPTGSYWMGSPRDEADRRENEDRVHVQLSGFYLGQHEVTQDQWQRVTKLTLEKQQAKQLQDLRPGAGPDHPIYYVSFDDATEFCQQFTAQEREAGRLPKEWEYRLPTESEWEYACRAESRGPTAFGRTLTSEQAQIGGQRETAKVGSFPANAWGLCDMHGNVSEWCRDWYCSQLPGGRDPEQLWPEFLRTDPRSSVHRGGDYLTASAGCRSAARAHAAGENRNFTVGLRVALVHIAQQQ